MLMRLTIFIPSAISLSTQVWFLPYHPTLHDLASSLMELITHLACPDSLISLSLLQTL